MASVGPAVAATLLVVTLVAFILIVWACGHMKRQQVTKPTTDLISAYKTQKWWSLACSFFAAAFGASALLANPEAGATGGWIQVFCYGIANALPYFALAIIGPRIQDFLHSEGFTVADFVYKRYGLLMFVPTILLSVFFLFIWLTAELTSVADSFSLLAPDFYSPASVIVVGLGVAVYALFAGFKGSLLTDRIQATIAIICTLMLLIACFCKVPTTKESWHTVSTAASVGEGLSGGIVLIVSTTLNQFLDLGSWQRVFASESHHQAKVGLIVAGAVNFVCQALITFTGLYAGAAAVSGQIEMMPGDEALGFYLLIGQLPMFFNIVCLIYVLVLAISTVDSIENSLASAFAQVLVDKKRSLNWARLFALVLIGLSIVLSTTNQSVLSLFLLSNIFASCLVPPVFLGLSYTKATSTSAFVGFVSAVLTIFVVGWSVEKNFVEGLKWPMFPKGFSHWTTLLTFVLCPVVAGALTIGVAHVMPDRDAVQYHVEDDPYAEIATN